MPNNDTSHQITPSCGCVFCDLGLDAGKGHNAVGGGRFINCSISLTRDEQRIMRDALRKSVRIVHKAT